MAEPGERMTIDQLAARVGMTARNVRAYQGRGLLPPPELEGRTGYYGPAHVDRLEQVRRLQDDGMNLAAIALVLADDTLSRALLDPFADEVPYEVAAGELARRLGAEGFAAATGRAVALGLVEPLAGDTLKVLLPAVVRRSEELGAMGVPLDSQLDTVAVVHRATHEIADAFLALTAEHLVERVAVDTGGDPDKVVVAVEHLSEVAADVVRALFNQAMTERLQGLLG
ncbi:MerR family transcriptional regulator [soil metagenome]